MTNPIKNRYYFTLLFGVKIRKLIRGAIYKRFPYPLTWLQAAVNRCRGKQEEITYQRTAIIQACLMTNSTTKKEKENSDD